MSLWCPPSSTDTGTPCRFGVPLPALLRIVDRVLVVIRLGERGGEELVRLLQLLHRQLAVVLARAEPELALRVHLERHEHPRLAGLARLDAVHFPPAVAVQLLCGAPRAAQHVNHDALVAGLRG